jgi:PKD repeat protein
MTSVNPSDPRARVVLLALAALLLLTVLVAPAAASNVLGLQQTRTLPSVDSTHGPTIAADPPAVAYANGSNEATNGSGAHGRSRQSPTPANLTDKAGVPVVNFYVDVDAGPGYGFFNASTTAEGQLFTSIVRAPITFTDNSVNSPTSWRWEIDGATVSTASSYEFLGFTTAGDHTVRLFATNTYGTSSRLLNFQVRIPDAIPVADFTYTPTTGNAPLTVQFIDTSTHLPTAWLWTFGDGTTSTWKHPTHTYTAPGTYTVTLRATNERGFDDSSGKTVTVTALPPVANFWMDVHDPGQAAGLSYFNASTTSDGQTFFSTLRAPITFTDNSANGPTSWRWEVDGATVSTARSLEFAGFTSLGHHVVRLFATNTYGVSSRYVNVAVQGITKAPVADFAFTPSTGTEPLTVQFTDTSVNFPTAWLWTFGDGTTSTERNPTHTFTAAGAYTVTLRATNEKGSDDSDGKTVTVTSAAPVADFTIVPSPAGSGQTVTFTDTSTGSPTAWSWSFGDGSTSTLQNPTHVYTTASTYTVTLQVTKGVQTSTRSKTLTVVTPTGPISAAFSFAPSAPKTGSNVQFTDSSTGYPSGWTWLFGDGGTSTLQNPTHAYAATGTYTVRLTITRSGASSSTTTRSVTVTAPTKPTAAFTFSPANPKTGANVQFTDTSTGGPTGYFWSFGDGATSNVPNPVHQYSAVGTYTVTHMVLNGAGSSSTTKTVTVTAALVPVLVPGGSGIPRDLDGDGKYEDVNGNGRKDFADVTLYFNQMSWIGANEPLSLFDYNGNGRIDFADVSWLFTRL